MKKKFNRILSTLLIAVMLLTAAPISGAIIKADAAFKSDTSSYNYPIRKIVNTGRGFSSSHKGVDLTIGKGTDVYASKSGTVVTVYTGCSNTNGAASGGKDCKANGCKTSNKVYMSGSGYKAGYYCNNGMGNGIIIKNDDGKYCYYGHLSKINVNVNDKVTPNTVIGEVGSSGCSTGAHLHFAISTSKSSGYVNPFSYIFPGFKITLTNNGESSVNPKLQIDFPWADFEASQCKIYFGTSSSSLTKTSEDNNFKAPNCFYDLGKKFGNLTKGKTYYVKVSVTKNSTTSTSSVYSFVAGSGNKTFLNYGTVAAAEPTPAVTPTVTPVKFTSVWADNITKTDAQINANFDLTSMSSAGFYIGESSTSLTKISKNLSGGSDGAGSFKNVFYKMSKWYGSLKTDTTYYYKIYIIKDGKEYCTDVKSFKTLPETYSVTYNANGGSGAPSAQTKTQNQSLSLSKTVPTRSGYTFVKWNTKADGSGTSYSSGASYTGNTALTLYAQWNQIHSHVYSSVVTSPTCTSQGYTTHVCICGDRYTDSYVPAKNHTEGSWKITKNATENAEGEKVLLCKDCGAVMKTEVIPRIASKVVSVKVDDIELNYKDAAALKPIIESTGNGVKYKAEYKSSDSSVVVVDEDGILKTTGEGSAIITCTVTDEFGNTVKDTCTVKVSFTWWQWIIRILLLGVFWY